jgi:hypothetical protein
LFLYSVFRQLFLRFPLSLSSMYYLWFPHLTLRKLKLCIFKYVFSMVSSPHSKKQLSMVSSPHSPETWGCWREARWESQELDTKHRWTDGWCWNLSCLF